MLHFAMVFYATVAALLSWFYYKASTILPKNQIDSIVSSFRIVGKSFTYVWPTGNRALQLKILPSIALLGFSRIAMLLGPALFSKIVDQLGSQNAEYHSVISLVLFYSIVKFLHGVNGGGGIISSFHGLLWQDLAHNFEKKAEMDLLKKIHSLPLKWHTEQNHDELMGKLIRGFHGMKDMVGTITFHIVPSILDIIVALVYYTSVYEAKLSGVLGLTIFVFVVFQIKSTEGTMELHKKRGKEIKNRFGILSSNLQNFEAIRSFATEDFEQNRYNEALDKCRKSYKSCDIRENIIDACLNFIMAAGFLFGSIYCASQILERRNTNLNANDFSVFTIHLTGIFISLASAAARYHGLTDMMAKIKDIEYIIEMEAENDPNLKEIVIRGGKIEFKDVTFRYKDDDKSTTVYKHLSFTANPGETLAIVGPSGSGKTTVMKLLLGLFEPQEGQILIDGQNINKHCMKSLRKCFGIIPQDSVYFHESIEYNMKYGSFAASQPELEFAAIQAQIHDKIMSKPEGYETKIGDKGCKLSGGERQRLAIARAMLMKPKIMLLDEATSALDARTAQEVQKTLEEMCFGKTTVTIAHKLHTVVNVDKILVMKNGEIVEEGKHLELLANEGLYAEMWMKQAGAGV